MEVVDGLVTTIEYTLKNAKGEIVESSQARGAITFKMGSDRMLPGLAKVIKGMKVGEARQGTIPPGELVPVEMTAKREIPLSEFPEGVKPKLGDRFRAKDHNGQPVIFEVIEVMEEAVKVQLLHILHEEEIHYEVKVLAARRSNIPPPPPVDVPDMTEDLLEEEP
ncbi:FKBP-type peptidyl-prolyl cis-trans isomerase [Myxococcota bacterium]|nr:FKBP-type peptidyl-prolyl cis-trans isomerase [Myxococcota bacterium]MBU1432405.1 FKBP-type peptidyl-prolyl cis-trans isomerase [Myxococcota bacterium]MBU1899468.1 FKBP-type peptidyl-prolyl cis-trans isomerase [Myxococcota bacterium]